MDDTNGTYSVKSAYRRLYEGYTIYQLWGAVNWLKVWNLNVAPKVKNFMWRALRNCLPTLVNLRQKNVEVYPICPVCHCSLETEEHVLVYCSFAQRCWEIAKLDIIFNSVQSFQEVMQWIFNQKTSKELEIIGSVLWQIWAHRNNVVWNTKVQTPSLIVNTASSSLFQWQRAQIKQSNVSVLNDREGVLVWQKPKLGWVSCNVDATVFEDRGRSSFGCLLRNDQGKFLARIVLMVLQTRNMLKHWHSRRLCLG